MVTIAGLIMAPILHWYTTGRHSGKFQMRSKKRLLILSITLSVLVLIILFSSQRHLVASRNIVINVPVKVVWDYLSDNRNAKEWSIVFDHITPMASEAEEGGVGALRRCYRSPDEVGFRWDEETVEIDLHKMRRLRTYNVQDSVAGVMDGLVFNAYQNYEELAPDKTKLTFEGDLREPVNAYSRFRIWMIQPAVNFTFQKNLENIKAHLEQKENYVRPHPWMKKWIFEK